MDTNISNTVEFSIKTSWAKRVRAALKFVLDNIVWFLLIISIAVMGLIEPVFFSSSILMNILVQASVLGVLTAGISFAILLGEIDLSVTGIMGFSACIGTLAMRAGLPWYITIIFIIAMGMGFGFLNGVLVAKVKAVSLIETLALNMSLQGAVLAITQGRTIVDFPEVYKFIGQGNVFGFPILPVVFILIYVIIQNIWKRTALGRSMFAVGGNANCAKVSGIRVTRIKIYAFLISGTLAGLAGYLLSSYLGAVTATFGTEFQMNTIAAAVIGGVSLSGGRGKITGVLGGVLLLTVIQVGLQVLGLNSFFVTMAGGIMIFTAVLIDAIRVNFQG